MPAKRPSAKTSFLKRIPVGRADWPGWLCGAVLAAGAIAVYGRTFSTPPLFDDADAIVNNLTIRHWSTAFWPSINTTASGRPVLNLSLAINYAISGTGVWSYHALNLAIHILAGLTLFGIVRRTLRLRSGQALAPSDATSVAFGAALLWTLHPLQTESVTYLIQRAESLMGLFYLLTVYCFIRGIGAERADVGGPRTGRASGIWFALSVAACLLGMGTKEVMASAPLIVLLYDRTFVAGSFREAWRRRWRVYAALAATWLPLVGLVAGNGWDRDGASGFDVGITPWAYWLTQFEAVTRYLGLSVWPHPLVFEYGTFWVNRPAEVMLYALVVVGLTLAVLVALWRRPPLGFLGAWFFAILAPTSVMPGRVQMIVEHRMYLPLAAVIVAGVAGMHSLLLRSRDNGPRVCGPVVSVILLLALGLGLLTARRNEDYRSEQAIWSDTVAKRPNNERARNNLGMVWSKMPERLNDAVAQLEAALRLQPNYAEAHTNLGVALALMPGRLDDAIAEFQTALRLVPSSAEAHTDLGVAWLKTPGRLNDAIAQLETAVRLRPDYEEAHINLGIVWTQMPGRLNDGIAEFEAVLRLQPDDAEAHNNLGLALAKLPGRLADAVAHYEAALRLNPGYAEAHNNLAVALAQMPGRLNDAIARFEEALRLDPGYAEAHNNLGIVLGRMPGRLDDAMAHYEAAVRLKPDYAEAHNNLGVVVARIPGRLAEATAQFEAAVRLNPDYASAWHNLGASRFNSGNLPAAAAAFREELRLSPGNAAAEQALAAALRQARDH